MSMTETNSKMLTGLITQLDALENAEAKVGWFESAVYENGRPVAAVAAGNEVGIPSRSIPPRPFFRPTADAKEAEWGKTAETMAGRVIEGKATAEEAMEVLGLKAGGDVLETIVSITSPALSPITILARAYRKNGKDVTGKTIGEIAGLIKNQRYDITASQMAGVSTKPLNDTGHMIATLSSVTINNGQKTSEIPIAGGAE